MCMILATAFFIFMATGSKNEAPRGRHLPTGASPAEKNHSGGPPRRPSNRRRPRPNHFLSVRINDKKIWENISSLQSEILASNAHLTDAAIPVQDGHLTLFVLSLHDHDGSKQRAKETLENCGDILREYGLYPEEAEPPSSQARASATESLAHGEGVVSGAQASPLTLSFHGLGDFRDRVLFAKLVEDEQSARFRSLTSALHQRFSQACLVEPAAPRPDLFAGKAGSSSAPTVEENGSNSSTDYCCTSSPKGGGGGYHYEFTPHLTVMKTSKLRDKNALIPPSSYERRGDAAFGNHAPTAVELSSMVEREDVPPLAGWEGRPYYKCEHKLPLYTSPA